MLHFIRYKLVISSAGQFPQDFKKGTLVDFGDFDKCMELKFPISTRYCVASFILKNEFQINRTGELEPNSLDFIKFAPERSLTLKIGICLPQACSSKDLTEIFNDGKLSIFKYWSRFIAILRNLIESNVCPICYISLQYQLLILPCGHRPIIVGVRSRTAFSTSKIIHYSIVLLCE